MHAHQDLERCKQLIEGQRLENFSITTKLMVVKAELAKLKATTPLSTSPSIPTQESSKEPHQQAIHHLTSPPRLYPEMPSHSHDDPSHRETSQQVESSWYDEELERKRKEVS